MLMKKTAIWGLLSIFSVTLVFHGLVLLHVIPVSLVWGGKIGDHRHVIVLEFVSLFVNAVFLGVALIKADYLKITISSKTMHIVFWIMAVLFLLNTLGNSLSENSIEKFVFAPLTLLVSLCCFLLIASKE